MFVLNTGFIEENVCGMQIAKDGVETVIKIWYRIRFGHRRKVLHEKNCPVQRVSKLLRRSRMKLHCFVSI